MAPTRPLQIWQDATATEQGNVKSAPRELNNPSPFFPSKDCNELGADHDAIFNPPSSASSGRSPLKPMPQPNSTPHKASIPNIHVPLPPPRSNLFKTDSPPKRAFFGALPPVPHPKIPLAMFGSFPSSRVTDKENSAPNIHSENIAEFSEPPFDYQPSLKRSLPFSRQVQEDEATQATQNNQSHFEIPEPQTLPRIVDDGNKPQYSYASLIGMAILRSPDRKLTLAQIYKWISDSFAHYRKANDSGWQNSIRHNLSLNKAFVKQERPKDDPGKGNYWAIKPGCESQFFHKEKGSRRPHSSSNTQKVLAQTASSEPTSLPTFPKKGTSSAPNTRNEGHEPSSDATIPASDAPSSIEDEDAVLPRATSRGIDSSPLLDIRSSPPMLPALQHEQLSPIPQVGLPALTKADRKKRKHNEMEDSGYFSSLDSSVTRPGPEPQLPRFEGNIKRIRRGRAEEEIARMRSSSHDISPTKIRSFMKQPTPSLASSSPLRSLDTALMPPPLTPAVNLKMPLKPPPSVSPSTNLRIHRENIRQLLGSPANRSPGDDTFPSPAFKLPEDDLYILEDGNENGYGILNVADRYASFRSLTSSPLKRSVRATDRARKTSNVLADVTGAQSNKLSASSGRAEAFESPLRQKSQKSPLRFGSNLEENDEDLFGVNFSDCEDADDSGGFDLTQGFAKIGSQNGAKTTASGNLRPKLGGRSETSYF